MHYLAAHQMMFNAALSLPAVAEALRVAPLTLVDVGAAGGIDADIGLTEFPAVSRFFGFEANPAQFAKLKSGGNVQYFPTAISDAPGLVTFHASGTIGSLADMGARTRAFGTEYDTIEVSADTIANLRTTGVLPQIDIIKSDTEGWDLQVFRGAGPFLDEVLCIKTECDLSGARSGFTRIDDLLRSRGFVLFGLQTGVGTFHEPTEGDAIYLRDVRTMKSDAQAMRLYAVAMLLRRPEYAYTVAVARGMAALADVAAGFAYRPLLRPLPLAAVRHRFAHVLTMLALLLAGREVRTKSVPRPGQLRRYRSLFRRDRNAASYRAWLDMRAQQFLKTDPPRST